MIFDIFPTRVGVWHLDLGVDLDTAIANELRAVHACHRTGEQIWDRKPHDIFDGSLPACALLVDYAREHFAEFVGERGRVAAITGREIVREPGVEIMPHSDADDAHVHGAYFPMGAEIDPSRPLLEQVNAFGPNGYAICGSDFRSAATEAGLLPWEEIRKYWVKPHRGLLVAFDARAVHFQRPHAGPGQFAQALLNVRVERTHG